MFEIKDADGKVLHRHLRFSTIRALINSTGAQVVTLTTFRKTQAILTVILNDGCSFTCIMEKQAAQRGVARWRYLHGTPLIVDRKDSGVIERFNPALEQQRRCKDPKLRTRQNSHYKPSPEEMRLALGYKAKRSHP